MGTKSESKLPEWTMDLISHGGSTEKHIKKIIELYTQELDKFEKLEKLTSFLNTPPFAADPARKVITQEVDDLILESLKEIDELPDHRRIKILGKLCLLLENNGALGSPIIREVVGATHQRISSVLSKFDESTV